MAQSRDHAVDCTVADNRPAPALLDQVVAREYCPRRCAECHQHPHHARLEHFTAFACMDAPRRRVDPQRPQIESRNLAQILRPLARSVDLARFHAG
jgi:hypothetical protein